MVLFSSKATQLFEMSVHPIYVHKKRFGGNVNSLATKQDRCLMFLNTFILSSFSLYISVVFLKKGI